MSQNNIFPFSFHGDKLYIVEFRGEPYVAMKHVVEGMGLAWSPQHKRLTQRFTGGITQIVIPLDGVPQDMVCLSLRKLPGWLMSINPNKVAPEIREKVVQYQQECDDALYDYWTKGVAINPRLKLKDRLMAFERLHSVASQIYSQRRPSLRKLLQTELEELSTLLNLPVPEHTPLQNTSPDIGDARIDGDAMYEFWDLYEMLENELAPKINHSADTDTIAIDPFEFRQFCEARKLNFPDINQMREELHEQTRYPFIEYRSLISAITDKPVQCWVFRCR
ncbi:phage antirepressor N-terminal domain-containing protein [Citrobacter portucalensis]|uniref:phage antirepressor N-terminal domain-containing protein n=1 Tax=Citrobacter portucalensis TaxID=1639133 RepID=UPI00226B9EF8|nr:phage antirepressor N-terminal domain-containing protein [Citrobacter portucalensis]MCX9061095.1 phage antirepressor N-terminal domain-containing protein [Citrobacter portucalensis]